MRMTRLVISFNRHFFAIALVACAVAMALLFFTSNDILRAMLISGIALAGYFMIASVIASYCIYDASDLYKLKSWPECCLEGSPENAVLVHAGFDPASPAIQAKYPNMRLRVLDFFHEHTTTEASIQRARQLFPPAGPEERISADVWPVASGSQDAVFLINSAHELRKPEERTAFFREAHRVLKEDGKIIVIEQLRNAANFACFGVAAMHFHSRRTWMQAFTSAELTVAKEFAITPFVRVFVMQPKPIPDLESGRRNVLAEI